MANGSSEIGNSRVPAGRGFRLRGATFGFGAALGGIPWRRWSQWAILTIAALLAWGFFMIAAVLQRQFIILFFPAGWCLYVALRQFQLLQRRPRE